MTVGRARAVPFRGTGTANLHFENRQRLLRTIFLLEASQIRRRTAVQPTHIICFTAIVSMLRAEKFTVPFAVEPHVRSTQLLTNLVPPRPASCNVLSFF